MTAQTVDKIKTIIVDDERLAIRGMELLLGDYPWIDVAGTAGTVDETVHLVESIKPDLIFLDIQLQGETGFDLFERTAVVDTRVVFVTAYDAYAVRAFEVNALDYLLKPVARLRLDATMDRVRNTVGGTKAPDGRLAYEDVAALKTQRGMKFVHLDRITRIHAEGDYTRVCTADDRDELVPRSMKAWEALLPRDRFVRVHRSTILNMAHVQKIERTTSNRYLAYMAGGTPPTPISQRYSALLRRKIRHRADIC